MPHACPRVAPCPIHLPATRSQSYTAAHRENKGFLEINLMYRRTRTIDTDRLIELSVDKLMPHMSYVTDQIDASKWCNDLNIIN